MEPTAKSAGKVRFYMFLEILSILSFSDPAGE